MRKKSFKRWAAIVMAAAMVVSGVQPLGIVKESKAATKTLTDSEVSSILSNNTKDEYTRVSVHDPSVVVGYYEGTYSSSTQVYGEQNSSHSRKEIYFVFGSHMAWYYSLDLENWEKLTNNINTDYATIFETDAEWSAKGSASYDVSGNLWAPDVIWNPTMNKWCMYMSVNGDKWFTSVVLLTANSLNGSWTRVGPVVYSGFTSSTSGAGNEDYKTVTGESSVPARYSQNRNGNITYGMNAIDPCVLYDDNDDLWMSYGSWFGGIYMLELDKSTGLRDTNKTYTTDSEDPTSVTEDKYMGIKIAGGNNRTGEASYIQKINGKYYLFMSYGALEANGGYNMRVFSSDSITGPYKDMSGDSAMNNTGIEINGSVGSRLMSYYKWSFMDYGFCAQGHNSAFVDDDGKAYVVYHTRFNQGTEEHQVRVHQLFQAENGGLVTAPFEYSGESLAASAYETSEVVGKYNILTMTGMSYKSLECVQEQQIELTSDGKVSGAYTGTWEQTADGPYLTLKDTNNNITYQGVFIKQCLENTGYQDMCLTVVGTNDIAIWGYKVSDNGNIYSEDVAVALDSQVKIASQVYKKGKLDLPATGENGSVYTWKSGNTAVISDDGQVASSISSDTKVTFTLTVTNGSYSYTTTRTVTALSSLAPEEMVPTDYIVGKYNSIDEFNAASPSGDINNLTGLSISFSVEGVASDWNTIMKSTNYTMHLSVLTYGGSDFYEKKSTVAANSGYTSGNVHNAYVNKKCYVTVSFNLDGTVSYYLNGDLLLTYAADITPSYPTTSTVTPRDVANAVVGEYKSGLLKFNLDPSSIVIGNIIIGAAADFDSSTYAKKDFSAYKYYADYDNEGSIGEWTVSDVSTSTGSDDEHGLYAKMVIDSSKSGNRGVYLNLGDKLEGLTDYTIETDVALSAGSTNKRSMSQFGFFDSTVNSPSNSGYDSGYIFKLANQVYWTERAGREKTWYINRNVASEVVNAGKDNESVDEEIIDTDEKITVEAGEWFHIKGHVDTTKSNIDVVITGSDGTELFKKDDLAYLSETGVISGIYALLGRGSGALSIDNIKVYEGDKDPLDKDSSDTPVTPSPGAGSSDTPVTPSSGDDKNSNKDNSSSTQNSTGNGSTTQTTTSTTSDDEEETSGATVGSTVKVGKFKYKVASKTAVTLTGVNKKTYTSLTVGKTVKIKGKSYKITKIGNSAFANCKKLTKVTIGANVTQIGKKAFFKDSKLRNITVKSKKLKSVGASAFKGIHKKAKIKVPASKLAAYKKTLKGKGQASSVKIKK